MIFNALCLTDQFAAPAVMQALMDERLKSSRLDGLIIDPNQVELKKKKIKTLN